MTITRQKKHPITELPCNFAIQKKIGAYHITILFTWAHSSTIGESLTTRAPVAREEACSQTSKMTFQQASPIKDCETVNRCRAANTSNTTWTRSRSRNHIKRWLITDFAAHFQKITRWTQCLMSRIRVINRTVTMSITRTTKIWMSRRKAYLTRSYPQT